MPAPELVRRIYQGWAANLRSLPADFGWQAHPGITLIGDAAHLMPPLGVGVNLAMLDAADLAVAIGDGADWQEGPRQSEIRIRDRAQSHMREIIQGFTEWFAGPSPVRQRA